MIKTIILNILIFNIFLSASSINVNSMVNKLSLEQKIGQMFMLRYTGDFYRNDDPRFIEIKKMIIRIDIAYAKFWIYKTPFYFIECHITFIIQ